MRKLRLKIAIKFQFGIVLSVNMMDTKLFFISERFSYMTMKNGVNDIDIRKRNTKNYFSNRSSINKRIFLLNHHVINYQLSIYSFNYSKVLEII